MALIILTVLLVSWIALDLAACRWGVDSSDRSAANQPYRWEQQRAWRDN